MKGQELGGRNITVDQANHRPRRYREWTAVWHLASSLSNYRSTCVLV
jgi:hypothetical protein